MNDLYFYRVELSSNSNLFNIDWMDLEDFATLSVSAKTYKYQVH